MTKFFLTSLVTLTLLQAEALSSTLLENNSSQEISKNFHSSHFWEKKRASLLKQQTALNFQTTLHQGEEYTLKKGWNRLSSPKDGIEVQKSFKDIEVVFIYDTRSQLWAGYTPNQMLMKKMQEAQILQLKYIEPHQEFYVLSPKKQEISIISEIPNAQCQALIKNENYEVLADSGLDDAFTFNDAKSIGLRSRYYSHTRKGVYNDSRVMIIVPKLQKLSTNKEYKKYGPAIPKMMLHFNEAYAEKVFYAYDFLEESCRKGKFPSYKTPPAPVMQKVK